MSNAYSLKPATEISGYSIQYLRRLLREGLRAQQLDDGRHICVHELLNMGHLFAHLRGEITLGIYLLDQESQARFLVLDADDEQCWDHLRHLARDLADEDVPAYLERSDAVATSGCSWPRLSPGGRCGLLVWG